MRPLGVEYIVPDPPRVGASDGAGVGKCPEAGKICLLTLNNDRERKFVLHWFGEKDFATLKPGEFRLMDAPVLERDEMLNARQFWYYMQ